MRMRRGFKTPKKIKHDKILHTFLLVPLCTQFPILPIFVVDFFFKALMSILASYSFVNIPSTARASTPQLCLMALGLAVHVAQSVAVFGMMEAAWSRFVVRKSHHLDSWDGAFGLFVGFKRHRTKMAKQYAKSHTTSK